MPCRRNWWRFGQGFRFIPARIIAEIVRSSIEAVPKGQHEAAQSLGLRRGQKLFLITLPQAVRMMMPPLTSQYLNLIKNSSLGCGDRLSGSF